MVLRGRVGHTDVAVLTITQEELNEACDVFGVRTNLPDTLCFARQEVGDGEYDIVVAKALDRSNVAASEAVTDLVEDLRPSYIFLVGTAGGVDPRENIAVGDVVVADFIDYAEFRKVVAGDDRRRNFPHDHPSLFLRMLAEGVCHDKNWAQRIRAERPVPGYPRVIVGNILAGEKIRGDRANPEQVKLLGEFDKAVAIDTESMGAARAVFHARKSTQYNPMLLVVRGISDLVNTPENNNDMRPLWTRYAASAAATFSAAVIARLPRRSRSAEGDN